MNGADLSPFLKGACQVLCWSKKSVSGYKSVLRGCGLLDWPPLVVKHTSPIHSRTCQACATTFK